VIHAISSLGGTSPLTNWPLAVPAGGDKPGSAGRVSRPAGHRVLPSGDRLVSLELSMAQPGRRTETVPVVWFEAPALATMLDVDEQAAVVGRVRRRFFRSGGSTQSRTEVVADTVVPLRRIQRAHKVLAEAVSRLDAALELEPDMGMGQE